MNTGSALARFTITLSTAVTEPIQVEWHTSDGTAKASVDYAANKGIVVFAPGETAKTVDILVYGRAVGAEDRSFYVEMLPPTNAILGASIGECIITVDTSGSTPVTQIIVPTGPRGLTGKSAYQSYLDTTTDNPPMTEPEWVESLKGDPEEIAQEVAPLIDVGAATLVAEGTDGLSKPDSTSVKTVARRVAYAAAAKIATVVLADGENTLSTADLSGDEVSFYSSGFVPKILRSGVFISADWTLNANDTMSVFGAIAGDVLYAVQYDFTSKMVVESLEPGIYCKHRSFEKGTTAIRKKNDALLWESAPSGAGPYFVWGGALPKDVPVGSSPATTGGISDGAWVDVGDASLNWKLNRPGGASVIGLPSGGKLSDIVIPVSDVSKISNMEFHEGLSYRLASWRPILAPVTSSYGGGEFYYSSTMPRSLHNGGTIIDVTVPYSDVDGYLAGTGTTGGNGCLVRKGTETEFLMSWFGAVPNTETVPSTASAQKCIDESFKYLKPAVVDFSIIVEKPLVLTRATTLRGLSKYKCFIFKTTNTKSGLPNMLAPTDSGGASVSYDVDAVLIIKPQNDGEYAAWVILEDFSVEKNNSPSATPMPLLTYGIYAPYLNMSQISRCQAYKVDYAIYSYNMFMTQISDWRGHLINHNIYVVEGGTSLVCSNVWAVDIHDTAYYFKNVGYSNLILSVDRCYRNDVTTELVYPYIFEGCVNTNALLSLEETEGCGVIQVLGSSNLRSNLKITMYAASGVRQHTTTVPKPAVNIGGSDVTFENTNIKFHPGSTGNIAPMFVHDSNITAINTDYFRDNFFSSDDDASKMIYIGSALSVRGKSGGSAIEATLGTDLILQGDYDRGGKIKFFGVNGALYGTLFANSAGNLLWKPGGTPANNIDGTKLN